MGLYEHYPYANFHELNLNWIIITIKELKTRVSNIENWHDDWQERLEELDEEYSRILALYDTLEHDFDQFKIDVNDEFQTLENDLIREIRSAEQDLINDLNAFKAEVNFTLAGYQNEITAMDTKLNQAIEHLADSLTIINPFTGLNESLEDVITQLAHFHMENAITAGEYDALALTAQTYDNKHLTAYQYDIEAKLYLL